MNNDGKVIDPKLAAGNPDDSQSDPLDTEGSTKRGRRRTPAGGSRSPQNSEETSRPADLLVLKKLMEKRDPNAKEVYDTLIFRVYEAAEGTPEYQFQYVRKTTQHYGLSDDHRAPGGKRKDFGRRE